MRFLIAGCGSIGLRHAQNLIDLGHEVAAYNRGSVRRKKAHEMLGIRVYSDYEQMLEEEDAAAVFVCTPNHVHVEHAIMAAEYGFHLFIEKPVAHRTDRLGELEALIAARGLTAHVGSNMRFHFGPQLIKKALDDQTIGRPLWAQFWGGMHLPDWHPDEDYTQGYSAKTHMGGGVILDFIHELDLVLWMFGMPVRVVGSITRSGSLEIETEDIADAIFDYADGLQISVHVDYLQRPFQRGIRLVGECGWIEWDLAAENVRCFSYESDEETIVAYPDGYSHNQMYVAQLEAFVGALQKKESSISDLAAGRRALELGLDIKNSSASNRFIIRKSS